jgi:hypothetical protein
MDIILAISFPICEERRSGAMAMDNEQFGLDGRLPNRGRVMEGRTLRLPMRYETGRACPKASTS